MISNNLNTQNNDLDVSNLCGAGFITNLEYVKEWIFDQLVEPSAMAVEKSIGELQDCF